MSDKTRKKVINFGIIIAIISLPVILLSTPVLKKYQSYQKERYKKLKKKRKNGKVDEEKWQAVKDRIKFLADLYRFTIRPTQSMKTYKQYHKWFEDDWKKEQYLVVKFRLASMYEKLAEDYPRKRTKYKKKAACHYTEIMQWYQNREGSVFRKFMDRAGNALRVRLKSYRDECY